MTYNKSKKEIIKIIQKISPKYGLYNVFRDFLTLASCTISNGVDKKQWREREEMYLQTIQKYERDEANLFAQILALTVLGLEDRLGDFIGELYMELEISNKDSGQFFTPYDTSRLIAQLAVRDIGKHIEKQGFVTLNEHAVGSGGMIIAFAEAMREAGYNYQTQLKVICNDVDYNVVKMCYIQLSLVGIDAVVMQGNTIIQKFNEIWYTPVHLLNQAREQQEQKMRSAIRAMQEVIELTESINVPNEPIQLSLFDFDEVV